MGLLQTHFSDDKAEALRSDVTGARRPPLWAWAPRLYNSDSVLDGRNGELHNEL